MSLHSGLVTCARSEDRLAVAFDVMFDQALASKTDHFKQDITSRALFNRLYKPQTQLGCRGLSGLVCVVKSDLAKHCDDRDFLTPRPEVVACSLRHARGASGVNHMSNELPIC